MRIGIEEIAVESICSFFHVIKINLKLVCFQFSEKLLIYNILVYIF